MLTPTRVTVHRFPAESSVMLSGCTTCQPQPTDVELLLAERGVVVSYETVRRWSKKFGQTLPAVCDAAVRGPGQMVPDEVHPYPGPAALSLAPVDQDGVVLDILVQPRRDAKAAKHSSDGC